MLYVPRHLPNRLEYKVLSCISVHYQSRMASNGITITPPYPLTVQAGQYWESFHAYLRSIRCVFGWGGVAANKCVRCMQWWCCGFVFGRRGQLWRREGVLAISLLVIRD